MRCDGSIRAVLVHEADYVSNGGVVAQFDLIVTGDAVGFTDRRKYFRLLDRVDTQVGFEIQIQIEHVDGIAGFLGDQRQDPLLHRFAGYGSFWLWCRRDSNRLNLRARLGGYTRRRSWCRLGSDDGCARRGQRCLDRGSRSRYWFDFLCDRGDPGSQPLIAHAERTIDHFQVGGWTSRHPGQPRIPRWLSTMR